MFAGIAIAAKPVISVLSASDAGYSSDSPNLLAQLSGRATSLLSTCSYCVLFLVVLPALIFAAHLFEEPPFTPGKTFLTVIGDFLENPIDLFLISFKGRIFLFREDRKTKFAMTPTTGKT